MNRIASHLVGMGAYGLDLGTFSPFLYAFREREMILDLFEEVCGARLTYSYITIGGVHDDLPDGWVERCQQFLDYLKPRIEEYHTLLTTQPHLRQAHRRTSASCRKEMALELRLHRPGAARLARSHQGRPRLGPAQDRAVLRLRDLRLQGVVAAAAIPTSTAGSGHRRLLAPVLRPHARSGREHQDRRARRSRRYPTAPGLAPHRAARSICPPGEAYVETECPRGQMGFYVVGSHAKGQVPLRVRARSSSFCNLSVTNEICRGCLIADVPAIVGSIDIVMGEIDR